MIAQALIASFAFKPAIGAGSPIVGRFLACWIFVHRLTSPFQYIKAVYRIATRRIDPITPYLQEVYELVVILGGLLLAHFTDWTASCYAVVVFLVALVVLHEVFWSSLFYTVLRRMFERDKPISDARRFLINIVECLKIIIWIAIARIALDPVQNTDPASLFRLAFADGTYGIIDSIFNGVFYVQVSVCLVQGLANYLAAPAD